MARTIKEIPQGSVGRDGLAFTEQGVQSFRMPRLARISEKIGRAVSFVFVETMARYNRSGVNNYDASRPKPTVADMMPEPRTQRIIGRALLGVAAAMTLINTPVIGPEIAQTLKGAGEGIFFDQSSPPMTPVQLPLLDAPQSV